MQVVCFVKVAVLKVRQRFLAVQVTKIVFQLVSAAFFQCHGLMFKGFKYIYPSQRFLLLPIDVSFICGRLLRRSTHFHTKICFSVELFAVHFSWNLLGMSKSRWFTTSALFAWISYWFGSRSFGVSADGCCVKLS